MKRKELKQLAQKIAKLENIIQTSDDEKKIAEAQRQIIELSGHVETLDDMCRDLWNWQTKNPNGFKN